MIAYCTIGNTASGAWFALEYLIDCPDARVYYAPDAPIETQGGLASRGVYFAM